MPMLHTLIVAWASRARHLIAAIGLIALSLTMPDLAWSQSAPTAFKQDHVHYMVPDPAKAAEWYARHMGGTLKAGRGASIDYGKLVLRFSQLDKPGASDGSVIDHLGFSFADLPAKLAELQAAGVKIVSPLRDAPGIFKLAFIEDPWGGKIELVEDSAMLGLHHIHLRGPDPDALLGWVQQTFGGEAVKMKERIPAIKQGEVWVLALKSEQATQRSEGHVIDHLGYAVDDLEATLKALQAKGISAPPAQGDGAKFTIIESPLGIRVELIQWGERR